MLQKADLPPLDVGETLRDKRILFVGATGFVGKVALSMFLCRYPGIGKMFVLVRPGAIALEKITPLNSGPRLVRRNVGIALGVILASGAVAAAIACGVIYGQPSPPTHFSPVTNP